MNIKFDIIGITESRLKKNVSPIENINLRDYEIEHTPTESSNCGSLLYIKKGLHYKVRNDLKVYKSKKVESIFIKILNRNSKNKIVGCIYKHPSLQPPEFQNYLRNTLDTIALETKEAIIMGDFNINLLDYDANNSVSDFIDMMSSFSFLPYITAPTRITPHSKTLKVRNTACHAAFSWIYFSLNQPYIQ